MTHTIVGGPSKFDLMVSLFDSCPERQRHTVVFQFETGSDVEVRISQIQREDGSGENWNYEGQSVDGAFVKGYYNTKRRKGHMYKEQARFRAGKLSV